MVLKGIMEGFTSKCYGRYYVLITECRSQLTIYVLTRLFPSNFVHDIVHRIRNMSKKTGVPSGARTTNPRGAPGFIILFYWGSCYSIFSFLRSVLWTIIYLLSFFVWSLLCFDILLRITPLVSCYWQYNQNC